MGVLMHKIQSVFKYTNNSTFKYGMPQFPTNKTKRKYVSKKVQQRRKRAIKRFYRNGSKSACRPRNNPTGVMTGIKLGRTAKLRYVTEYEVTSTLGAIGNFKFRANGCHDPDYSGSGHQPYLWDQCKVFYNHYVVRRSNICVQIVAAGSGSPLSCVMGIYLDDDTTSPPFSDFSGYIEAGRGTYKMNLLRSTKPALITSNYDAKTFFNIDDIKDNVNRIGAAVTADPGEVAIYNVWFQTLDGSTITAQAIVTIDYDIEFSELTDIGQS